MSVKTRPNSLTGMQLYGLDQNGIPTAIVVDDSGNFSESEGLASNIFQMEVTRTLGAGQAFATVDLVPIMKLCPDLSAAQLAQPDADYSNVEVAIYNSSDEELRVSRTDLLGLGGDYTSLSPDLRAAEVSYEYSSSTEQNSIALSTPSGAVTYQIQVTFRVEEA